MGQLGPGVACADGTPAAPAVEMTGGVSQLNPYAKEFLPQSTTFSVRKTTDDIPHGEGLQPHGSAAIEDTVDILDLPEEVLGLVAASLKSLKDIQNWLAVCKKFLRAVSHSAIILDLGKPNPTQKRHTLQWLPEGPLEHVKKLFPGALGLLLSNWGLADREVAHLRRSFSHLLLLDLSGCTKLTPCILTTLLNRVDGSSPGSGSKVLKYLNLQRCYQLTSEVLTRVLTVREAQLEGLAVSHIKLDDWACQPQSEECDPAQDADGASHLKNVGLCNINNIAITDTMGCKLRYLALNNCSQLTILGLFSIMRGCPCLTHLFLGGSTLASKALDAGAWLAAQQFQLLETMKTMLPGGPGFLEDQPSPDVMFGLVLGAGTASLPRMKVLEATFLPARTCQVLKWLLQQQSQDGSLCQVWDFCSPQSVEAAVQQVLYMQGQNHWGIDLHYTALLSAIKGAVNCSSPSRSTALHFAAFKGDIMFVKGLLQLGCQVNARESGGATSLFLACEAGHNTVVGELLARGADPLVGNTAGELPLYIASLRGHLSVVVLLLQHLQRHGVPWDGKAMYGDGWTPLMAAVVGSHLEVARYLVQVAGDQAGDMICAVNRYGQTAVHIAARRGCQALLELLLTRGGDQCRGMADLQGDCPLHIAQKNNNQAALALLAM